MDDDDSSLVLEDDAVSVNHSVQSELQSESFLVHSQSKKPLNVSINNTSQVKSSSLFEIVQHKEGKSLFNDNWVTKGSAFDESVMNHPHLYPEGSDLIVQINKVPKISGKYPRIGWAHTSKRKGKFKCTGAYICPEFGNGCFYRERPQVPRRGNQKYNTKGTPAPKRKCNVHDLELVLKTCDARWDITHHDNHWILRHHKSHNHPAPQLAGASDGGLQKLEEYLKVDKNLKPTDLAAGTNTRDAMTDEDPKFHNKDYLRHKKREINKAFTKHVTGSNFATEALDAAWTMFDGVQKWHDNIFDTCVGGHNRQRQIVIASPSMRERCRTGSNPFQTDAIMSGITSVYFPGRIYVTMTSAWCPFTNCQLPSTISIVRALTALFASSVSCLVKRRRITKHISNICLNSATMIVWKH